jgi:hypothetical protein
MYYDKNMCSKAAVSGCFPGDATVTLAGGATKRLRELQVGDKVAAVKADGTVVYEDVYFFDHQLGGSDKHEFVRIELEYGVTSDNGASDTASDNTANKAAAAAALELTPGHFVPVGGHTVGSAVMTRARDVEAGATMFVVPPNNAAAVAAKVVAVSRVQREGLYAPVTLGGTVVVDGVAASAYSDWILDPLFDFFGAAARLPAAMHLVHAPLRLAYAAMGPRALRTLSPLISGAAQLDARQFAAGIRAMSA